jgi:UDP-N-acetylmuramoyl-tripeptide--D-alanyl-D-alanine ligase
MMTTLAQVHTMLPGSRLLNVSDEAARVIALSRVGTDSRQIDTGELFIALSGERFDAHDFLVDVAKSGAGAALVSSAEKCPGN